MAADANDGRSAEHDAPPGAARIDGVGETEAGPPGARRSNALRRRAAERAILQAGARLIGAEGMAGLSLTKVGEAAGYSRGLPTHYFGRREDFVAALALHIVNSWRVAWRRRHRREGRPTGLAEILLSVDHYMLSVESDPIVMRALLVLMTEARRQPELLSSIIEINRDSAHAHARRIREGQAAGEISSAVDPDMQGILLVAQLRGAAAQWLLTPGAIPMEDLRCALRFSVLRSLGSPESGGAGGSGGAG